MEDRLVQYPNRVQLIQVEGQPGIYDIVPMPGTITSEGTPLNKLTLLSDSVAGLLGSPATPSEALGRLAERIQPIELGGTGDDLSNVPTGAIITKSSSNKLTYWNAVPIKHGGTGADNAEQALMNLGGISMVKVWENPAMNSNFPAQKISFEKETNDIVFIEYIKYIAEAITKSLLIGNGSGALNCARQIQAGTEPVYQYERYLDVSNSGVQFYNCGMKINNTFYADQNSACVPRRIYVFKGVK